MLERNHLHIIKEVHRLGSVTAAANSLNLSQSAVSHTIAKLENRFGIKIWQRKGNTLVYSQTGQYLLKLAEKVLNEFEHAERVLQVYAAGRRGIIRIGMECHPCEKWLMDKIRLFLNDWPEVDIELIHTFKFDGIAALKAGEIDLLVTPDPIPSMNLFFTPVFEYNLCAVVSHHHSLSNKKVAEPKDFHDEILYTVPVTTNRLDVYTQFLEPAKVSPKRRVQAESTDLILQLVSANRGISVLPQWLILPHIESLSLHCLKLGNTGITKAINIGLRNEDTKLDYMQGFLELAAGKKFKA